MSRNRTGDLNGCNPRMKLIRTISVAPMMDLTDRHFRFLARLLSRRILLYTEMLTSKAVIHGDRDYLLGYSQVEHPIALQLGGNDPAELVTAAQIGVDYGYDEINLNVGCPSDRVQSGSFGACLMAEPDLVGRCVRSMQQAVDAPVTVKCRIGIDRIDSWESLRKFVDTVAQYGCDVFTVHARKAWLDGLSPKENRTIPPLRYEYVYELKQAMPELTIVINGGIKSWTEIDTHLHHTDGVMIGREAYYNPALLIDTDPRLFGDQSPFTDLRDIALAYAEYMQEQLEREVALSSMTRHLIALYQHVPGARAWRRHLSMQHKHYNNAVQMVEDALAYVESESRMAVPQLSALATSRQLE